MVKFEFETLVNGNKIQNYNTQLISSYEKFTKISDKTLAKISNTVKEGNESNLQRGVDIFGKSVAPKVIPNGKPLFQNSGVLLRSVMQEQYGKNEWHIFINSNRSQIAGYLQTGTAHMIARPFFGISEATSKKIDEILDQSFSTPQ